MTIKRMSLALVLGVLAVGIAAPASVNAARTHTMAMESVMLGAIGGSGVTGTAAFTYNSTTKMTTVKLTVKHLKAMSVHPAHIHLGRCGGNGAVLYPFPAIHAGNNGIGVVSISFKGTFTHKMWYINVHKGPGLAGKQFTVISCGNVM